MQLLQKVLTRRSGFVLEQRCAAEAVVLARILVEEADVERWYADVAQPGRVARAWLSGARVAQQRHLRGQAGELSAVGVHRLHVRLRAH